jgi:hypothetical protein
LIRGRPGLPDDGLFVLALPPLLLLTDDLRLLQWKQEFG